jgi:hypothetical protein
VNNKTIIFVVVDIFEHGTPASKRGPMKSVDITAQELVQSVEVTTDLTTAGAGLSAGNSAQPPP